MKNKRGTGLIITGFILILAAAGLFGYNVIEERKAENSSGKAVGVLEQQIVIKEYPEIFENAAEAEIPDYILNPEMAMPETEIEGIKYIGTLEIPKIGLKLPVISEWSYPNLKIAPCRYFGSAYLDNIVIAAHNYKSHFREIENLSSGDEIIFTDTDGNVFVYSVGAKEVLPPTAIEEMTSGEWDLTLFTCNPAGTFRVAIRCDKK
ncbi:MAG: sortase [Oscillospiraceae bacterium]|nr:sortase [Oscillospiraceae bacterium]